MADGAPDQFRVGMVQGIHFAMSIGMFLLPKAVFTTFQTLVCRGSLAGIAARRPGRPGSRCCPARCSASLGCWCNHVFLHVYLDTSNMAANVPPAAGTFVSLDQTVAPWWERPGIRSARNRRGVSSGKEKPCPPIEVTMK